MARVGARFAALSTSLVDPSDPNATSAGTASAGASLDQPLHCSWPDSESNALSTARPAPARPSRFDRRLLARS